MKKYINGNKSAIIVLHEIYGINDFIQNIGQQYHIEGYDVFCPNLFLTDVCFPYSDSEQAYRQFMSTVGFEAYMKVDKLVNELKSSYETVVIIGFSVGATIAWRCSENASCDGVIGCYGSRIRDYLMVNPQCPVFLAFAKQDSFDVLAVAAQLQEKQQVKIEIMDAQHGFVDMYSKNYSAMQAQAFNLHRVKFLVDLKTGAYRL